MNLAPVEGLAGVDTVAPGYHRDALPGLQALAHHGQFLLDTPAATLLLAEHFDGFVFAGSHKHSRLPISYGRGKTAPCVSRGSLRELDLLRTSPQREG